MAAKVSINDKLLEQLRSDGEVRVEDMHGVPLILMTVDARDQLGQVIYDDSEWSADEQMSVLSTQLQKPDGWGHPSMDVYDKEYGHFFDDNDGKDQ